MDTSIVILTKNGGARFRDCIRALNEQRSPVDFEVLIIDSGSRDGTLEALSGTSHLRVIEIPSCDFQHGRTRNFAMRQCHGRRVIFLTQDAVPAGRDWLFNWVSFMDQHPGIAGAFGHQIPHEDADPLEAWDVRNHFESFRERPCTFRRPPQDGDGLSWVERLRIHYFSNVNSCINRWAWKRVPFPEIDFGEDQAWAYEIQQTGMETAYAELAVVRHSHDYDSWTLLRRRYDEARFMRRYFGYVLVPSWSNARAQAAWHTAAYRTVLEGVGGCEWDIRRTATTRAWASAIGSYAGTWLWRHEGAIHNILSLTLSRQKA